MKKELNIKSDLPILPIGAIAQSLGVHQRTLRIYDQEGILSPKRSSKNRRNYTIDDLEKGRLIQYLTRNLALNLSGVKIVLALLDNEKIKPNKYMAYIQKIASKTNIDTNIQEDNIKKTSKRGRKPSVIKKS